MKDRHARPRDRSDYQEHEAEYFAHHARPPAPADDFEPDYQRRRDEQMQALDEDYRLWRHDRRGKFGEAFDRWRASRPARSGAAGNHALPPGIGTDPGQPNSEPPGATGKNK